jgi:LmbE family N-acetylglucosaminyl deacetylase
VLAVVAHPDDESFGLGAILDAFVRAGARVEVLCLTQGEASTLHGAPGDLASVRGAELAAAADALGVTRASLHDHPDGALGELSRTRLATEVVTAAEAAGAQGLLVFDSTGVTGHPDHVAASMAALLAAETLNLPVLGWTLPDRVAAQLNLELGAGFTGRRDEDIDLRVSVDRTRQRVACYAHMSQALPGSVLWRRLELLADTESLRWLRPNSGAAGHPATPARHNLPTKGLAVEATFEMGSRPARVAGIGVRLIVPHGVPAERLDALLAVASHCTVHNTLESTPEVAITLVDAVAG